MEEIDQIIRKQIKLEKLLEKTSSPDKKIYQTQLKVWMDKFVDATLTPQAINMMLDNRIQELEKK